MGKGRFLPCVTLMQSSDFRSKFLMTGVEPTSYHFSLLQEERLHFHRHKEGKEDSGAVSMSQLRPRDLFMTGARENAKRCCSKKPRISSI